MASKTPTNLGSYREKLRRLGNQDEEIINVWDLVVHNYIELLIMLDQ
jgi:hypothetical protein